MIIQEPEFLKLDRIDQKAALEVLVFSAEEPISLDFLYKLLIQDDFIAEKNLDENSIKDEESNSYENEIEHQFHFSKDSLLSLIDEINNDLISSGRPFEIVNYAGGFQFSTRKEYGYLVQKFIKSKSKKRLSQAALEALAIIAYKQPISKPEIEQIRGVNSNEIVNSLMEKGFVRIAGRSEALGKPLLYATTSEFLRAFGINSLQDLPKLRELDDIADGEISATDNNSEIVLTVDNIDYFDSIDKSSISKIEIEKEINMS